MNIYIYLKGGYVATIDKQDSPIADRWHADIRTLKDGAIRIYVKRNVLPWSGKTEYLHRLIAARLGWQPDSLIDHIDRNPLNNTRSNLRLATDSQNSVNRDYATRSRFRGVYKHRNKWAARVTMRGTSIYLGVFKDECDAAQAYNFVAEELHGDFARLNRA